MNYPPDHDKILGYLKEMREQIGELSEQEYNERNAFALNLLNRKLIDLEKALQLLDYNIQSQLEKQTEISKAVNECYRPIKTHTPTRIDFQIISYYKRGVKDIKRQVEHLIRLITRKGKNKAQLENQKFSA